MGDDYKIIFHQGLKFKIRTQRIVHWRGSKLPVDLLVIYRILSQKIYNPIGFEIGRDDIIVDVGAHIGAFTIYAATLAQNGRVYSFEPHPENFALLKENVRLNNLSSRVKVFELAILSKGQDKVRMYLDEETTTRHSIVAEGPKYIEVRTTSLEDVFFAEGISRCDFLKMDCEGAEYEILFNTSEEFIRKVSKIALECHSKSNGDSIKELADRLKSHGFEVLISRTTDPGPTEVMMYCRR